MQMKTTLVAAGVAVAVLLGGCSSGSSSSSSNSSSTTTTTVSGKQPVCSARDDLEQSITALTKPSVLTGGTSSIKSAVDTVKKNLDSFQSAAKNEYQPQLDAVKTSVQDVDTAVGTLSDLKSLGTNLQNVGAAVTKLGDSAQTLFDTVKQQCPST